jgi:hypothetical protein
MVFCGDRIGPAGWWLRVAPPFYPPFPTRSTRRDRETFGQGHPKRGGKRTLFSQDTSAVGLVLELGQIS